jgi:hypothetical protein
VRALGRPQLRTVQVLADLPHLRVGDSPPASVFRALSSICRASAAGQSRVRLCASCAVPAAASIAKRFPASQQRCDCKFSSAGAHGSAPATAPDRGIRPSSTAADCQIGYAAAHLCSSRNETRSMAGASGKLRASHPRVRLRGRTRARRPGWLPPDRAVLFSVRVRHGWRVQGGGPSVGLL